MGAWQGDARAAGFDVAELTIIAEFIAGGVVAIDGPPMEVLPDYWVIPGFLPYDGSVILAAVDRRRTVVGRDGSDGDLLGILTRAVDSRRARAA
jgi:hypothetical protein